MKTKVTVMIALAISAMTLDVQASDGKTIQTRGGASCGVWLQETSANKGKADILSRIWLLGFLSGLSIAAGKDVLRGTDNAAIEAWTQKYCQENPLAHLTDAGLALHRELMIRKGL